MLSLDEYYDKNYPDFVAMRIKVYAVLYSRFIKFSSSIFNIPGGAVQKHNVKTPNTDY